MVFVALVPAKTGKDPVAAQIGIYTDNIPVTQTLKGNVRISICWSRVRIKLMRNRKEAYLGSFTSLLLNDFFFPEKKNNKKKNPLTF